MNENKFEKNLETFLLMKTSNDQEKTSSLNQIQNYIDQKKRKEDNTCFDIHFNDKKEDISECNPENENQSKLNSSNKINENKSLFQSIENNKYNDTKTKPLLKIQEYIDQEKLNEEKSFFGNKFDAINEEIITEFILENNERSEFISSKEISAILNLQLNSVSSIVSKYFQDSTKYIQNFTHTLSSSTTR